jgi:beta-glucosidase
VSCEDEPRLRAIFIFCSRYGLSYTTFKVGQVSVSPVKSSGTESQISVSVSVTNTGNVTGSEVVQVYIALPRGHLTHPLAQLKGFKKVHDIKAGATETIDIVLDKYALSYWDDIISKWRADKGEYKVMVGNSSQQKAQEVCFKLEKAFEWSGL